MSRAFPHDRHTRDRPSPVAARPFRTARTALCGLTVACAVVASGSAVAASPRIGLPLAAFASAATPAFVPVTATTPRGAILAVAVPRGWAATEIASSEAFMKAHPESKPAIAQMKSAGGVLFALGPSPAKATAFRPNMNALVLDMSKETVTVADIVKSNAKDKPFKVKRLTLNGHSAVRFDYLRSSTGSGGLPVKSVRTAVWVIGEEEVIIVTLALPSRDDVLADAFAGSVTLL